MINRVQTLLQTLTDFTKKLSSTSKKVSPQDVSELHQAIKQANAELRTQTGKFDANKIVIANNLTALRKFRDTLGNNKGVIESAAAHIPFSEIQTELGLNEALLEKLKEETNTKVGGSEESDFDPER